MRDHGGRPLDLQGAALEDALRAIGHRVEYPPVPDLWPAIEHQLQVEPLADRPRLRPRELSWPAFSRVMVTAVLIVLVMVGALVLIPGLRQAVAERFGLTGVTLQFWEEAPNVPVSPVGGALGLGQPVSLAEAVDAADFPLQAPSSLELGSPMEILVTYGQSNRMVSLVYPASDRLPASRYSGVGALLTQFRGTTERGLIDKGMLVDSAVTTTTVNGELAFWIDGAAHYFMYIDPAGDVQAVDYRLAGKVLLWEADGITYRLESELTREAALAIAESLQPVAVEGTD